HLFLLDTDIAHGTPAKAEFDGPSLASQLLAGFAHILCAGVGATNVMTELVGSGVVDEGFEAVVSLLATREVLPPGLGPEDLRRPFDVFQTIMAITQTYAPGPYAGDVTLIQPDGADVQEAQHARGRWCGVVAGRFESCRTPGDHFSMLREPAVKTIAE